MKNHSCRALRTLFARPDEKGNLVFGADKFIQQLAGVLNGESACGSAGKSDYLNELSRILAGKPIADRLYPEFFDILHSHNIAPEKIDPDQLSETEKFLIYNMLELAVAIKKTISDELKSDPLAVIPEVVTLASTLPDDTLDLAGFIHSVAASDRFSGGRAFRFDGEKVLPVAPDSCKATGKFFGFPGVRAVIADHFKDFGSGRTNIPLLIHSLPGYGKTSMTISYALADKSNTLILASPEALSGQLWHRLTSLLASRRDRRFILFFDDIEPENINWYNFRTEVGGAFSLPENILIVLASNYEFPASILSRGRSVTFPVFDELRCAEMIGDFLRDFGLHEPPEKLISLLGADYTESFGQKKFTELSPRTLMRHLTVYGQSKEKRKLLAEMADGEMITRPDPTLFYEFNINLMRTLYGDDYIARLREQKLREL